VGFLLAGWQARGAIAAVRRFKIGVGLGGLSKQAKPQSWGEVVYLGNRKKVINRANKSSTIC
jgi:hypothetical protein